MSRKERERQYACSGEDAGFLQLWQAPGSMADFTLELQAQAPGMRFFYRSLKLIV